MIHYFTAQGQYTVEAAADPGYYTGQYQHHQAQDFYSQVRVVLSLSSLGDSKFGLRDNNSMNAHVFSTPRSRRPRWLGTLTGKTSTTGC